MYVAGVAAGHAVVVALHADNARPLWERPLALGPGEARTLATTAECKSNGGAHDHGHGGGGVDVVVSGHLYHAGRQAHKPFVARIEGASGRSVVFNHHISMVATSTMTATTTTTHTVEGTTATVTGRDATGSSGDAAAAAAPPHGYWHLHWHHHQREQHEHETGGQRNSSNNNTSTTSTTTTPRAAGKKHMRTMLSVSHLTEVAGSFFLLATQTIVLTSNSSLSSLLAHNSTVGDDEIFSSAATDNTAFLDDMDSVHGQQQQQRRVAVTRRHHAFFACHRTTLECTKLHIPLTAAATAAAAMSDRSRSTSPALSLSDLMTSYVTALVSPMSSSSSSSQPPHAFVAAQSGLLFRIDFPSLSLHTHLDSPSPSTQQPQHRVVWTHHVNSSVLLASVDASTLVAVFSRGTHVAVYDALSGAPVSQWLRRGASHRRRHSRYVCLGVTTMLPLSDGKKRDGPGNGNVVHVAYVGGVLRQTSIGIDNSRTTTRTGDAIHEHFDNAVHQQQGSQNTMIPILSMLQVTKRHPVVVRMASPDTLLSSPNSANGTVSDKKVEAAAGAVVAEGSDGDADNNLLRSDGNNNNKLEGDGSANAKEASDNRGVVTALALVFALLAVIGMIVCCRMMCVQRLNRGSSFDSDESGNGFDDTRDMWLPVKHDRKGKRGGGGQQQQGWFSKWVDNNDSSNNQKQQQQQEHLRNHHHHNNRVQYHGVSGRAPGAGVAAAGDRGATCSTGHHHHHHAYHTDGGDGIEGNTRERAARASNHDGIDADIDDDGEDYDSDNSQCEVYRRSGKNNPLSTSSLARFTARTKARAGRARAKAKSYASKSMMHVHPGGHHHHNRGRGNGGVGGGGGGGGRVKMFHPSMPVRALSDPGGRSGKH